MILGLIEDLIDGRHDLLVVGPGAKLARSEAVARLDGAFQARLLAEKVENLLERASEASASRRTAQAIATNKAAIG
jgi:hypothetical protein